MDSEINLGLMTMGYLSRLSRQIGNLNLRTVVHLTGVNLIMRTVIHLHIGNLSFKTVVHLTDGESEFEDYGLHNRWGI